jgi:hypothetical protein
VRTAAAVATPPIIEQKNERLSMTRQDNTSFT